MTTKTNVGYIGLGNIGKPSARHLISEHYHAHVYDLVSEAVDELAAAGAVACDSVAELALNCSHIDICVRDRAQVESLLYAEQGIFDNAAAGTLITRHSTVVQANLLR